VVAHEREHVRAGDPRLLAAALAAAVLTPWNPAAWWQLRRLRLAIEVDCDARVLRRRGDVRAYGSALLEVGRRASRSGFATAAFAEPVSSLERRIRIMTAPAARRPLLRAAACGAVAAALAAAACEAPEPTRPASREPSLAGAASTPGTANADASRGDPPGVLQLADVDGPPEIVNRAAVQRALQEGYPPLLRDAGVEAIVTVSMVVGADGITRAPAVVHTSHEAFREPALGAVARMRFRPATKGGRAVPVRVTLPVAFQLSDLPPRRGPAPAGSADDSALRDAVRRHYPPLMRDAGVTAQVGVSFTVGADGKARGVRIVDRGVDPAFARAARAVVADLTFPPGGPGEERMMLIPFAPERTPAPAAR
jgi:TonB family protein